MGGSLVLVPVNWGLTSPSTSEPGLTGPRTSELGDSMVRGLTGTVTLGQSMKTREKRERRFITIPLGCKGF